MRPCRHTESHTMKAVLLSLFLTACGGGVAYEGEAAPVPANVEVPHLNNVPEPMSDAK
jgi:hypothetical protein